MKLSLDWLFDHIDADWRTLDIPGLIDRFNRTTAEIEGFYKVTTDVSSFALAEVTSCSADGITVQCAEWQTSINMPFRSDATIGDCLIIKKDAEKIVWVSFAHMNLDKAGLLPAVACPEDQRAGAWKAHWVAEDYIIEVDNKSITNRPDMWGHRGFAREVAAILGVKLRPFHDFLVTKPAAATSQAVRVQIQADRVCSQLVALPVDNIAMAPSALKIMHRLMKVGSKPINFVVDATNYVMQDVAHPMHAFDADALRGQQLTARLAHAGEKLTLLDGQEVELTQNDMVIADANGACALAGIMGGAQSSVSAATKNIIIEAACLDAGTIRRSAAHHKVRTEASMRFEKTLSPEYARIALMRFLGLLQEYKIAHTAGDTLVVAGSLPAPITLTIEHSFFERRIGVTLTTEKIIAILQALEFGVQVADGVYTIMVPPFRATKDVTIIEDVVEEVARFYGYGVIEPVLPVRTMAPLQLHATHRVRAIKRALAYGLQMREMYNYAFFDEDFLRKLSWQPECTIGVLSAVSENWQRLVTDLASQLLENVARCSHESSTLRFFEWARVWHKEGDTLQEQRRLGAIFYDKKNAIDFYAVKAQLEQLWSVIGVQVTWHQVTQPGRPWFAPYQTATVKVGDRIIGTVGVVPAHFLHQVAEGHALIAEFDGDFLLSYQVPIIKYKAPSKYPAVERDISMLIARSVMFDQLKAAIKQVDLLIGDVAVLDVFEKETWPDKKSVTVRISLQSSERTLTSAEVDAIIERVYSALKVLGAEIR